MKCLEPSFLFPNEQTLRRRFIRFRPRNKNLPFNDVNPFRQGFFWARNALFWSLGALKIPPGASVLVPSYICRAGVEPIIFYGAKVDYYAVTRDCLADLSDIEGRIKDDTKAVLAVHYFGFPQRTKALRALCDRFGLLLIEDCAHVLPGVGDEQSLGRLGDVSIFSWRKFLPVYDGGELNFNRSCPALDLKLEHEPLLLTAKIAKYMIENACRRSEEGNTSMLSVCMGLLDKMWSNLKRGPVTPDYVLSVHNNSPLFDEKMLHLPMSRLSRCVMNHSDISGIADERRANYRFLLQEFCGFPGIKVLHRELADGICPWMFPLFFAGIPDAHLILRSRGVPAVTWEGVRPPSVLDTAFPDTDFLYRNLVLLPVHQCLEHRDLETMVKIVKTV